VLRADEVARIGATARAHGLKVHCDGARLWNAAQALGTSERELVDGCDSVAVCFSKGLGAPVGSALVGPSPMIARARKIRKRFGGAMRQSGFLAAAALHGLWHHRTRLQEDHRRAARLAAALRRLPGIEVDYPSPGTNLVFFRPTDGRPQAPLVEAVKERGALIGESGNGWLRAVLHLDVGDDAVDALIAACERVLAL
jgi:threonine aldolase